MGLIFDKDELRKNKADTSVYTAGEPKRECAQRFLDGSYLFKAALRDFKELCDKYQLDFEDRVATLADVVNKGG